MPAVTHNADNYNFPTCGGRVSLCVVWMVDERQERDVVMACVWSKASGVVRWWGLIRIIIIPASGQKTICSHKMDGVASSPCSINYRNAGDNSSNFAPQ